MFFKNRRRLGFILALFILFSQSCLSVYGTEIINEDDASFSDGAEYSGEYEEYPEEEYEFNDVNIRDDDTGENTDDYPVLMSEPDASELTASDPPTVSVSTDGKILRVSYINVGHGDSILIEYGGEAVLVDGGENGKGQIVSDYIKQKGYKKLKMIIATHPHNDHVGGLPAVLSEFECDSIISARSKENSLKNKGLTAEYKPFLEAVKNKGLNIEYPSKGTEYKIGLSDNKISIKILGPLKVSKNINNNSLAFMLTFGSNKFLFVGDAENKEERDLVKSLGAENLKCDVYKAAHHGMNDSTSKLFLDTVNPTYSVISCDKNSKWKSPGKSCIKRLKKKSIKTFRTDSKGTIVATSDGTNITWNTSPDF
ncbi:MAG: MBL fold metallo-hydrolase [Lachnospiraceae bacterium]|nr:MBL fold metallo-hydrolase [Lachnospiraceae bacterium]